jgi:hypothetical protein
MVGDSAARRTRRALRDLERAREALAQALAERQDPWRVAELRNRERELADRALAVEDDLDRSLPVMRGKETLRWPVR